ncbi:unnamed protein product [Nippostrongylus brasiliensis]|uniref:Uncharacterized protein n=1 Tax=Nippostrongylus brasiliensis TaxID=27835 RepID=A0A0N4YTL3_NIPBR|nr:unnamed protein product [Nippostrongylus brasiliensis]
MKVVLVGEKLDHRRAIMAPTRAMRSRRFFAFAVNFMPTASWSILPAHNITIVVVSLADPATTRYVKLMSHRPADSGWCLSLQDPHYTEVQD